MRILRREFFAIVAAGAACAHPGEAMLDFAAYRPRAFSQPEYELLDALAETLLPADETGPGAHDAHVVYYIDVVLTHSPQGRVQAWKNGLVKLTSFVALSANERQNLMSKLCKNELSPQTEFDGFFVDLKKTVIDGFYASELIRREHLGYKGDTAVSEFPGCTHVDFQHPDNA